ncbi:putative ribonuclease H-like domain-containing protein [Tanacetum coccineum]|uniref:Ribonuclease H-like domain-containing protein n=1 Tax=Tanacetum coccineum TaxID=301880 RepID=A0ABQ4WTV8_9ASTR
MPTFSQPTFSQPAFPQPNQSIFSQPAVHFQQTQPTQTNQTASISANNAKFPYLEKDKYEIWVMKMEYWIQNADHNLWRIVQQGNSPKRLGKDAKGNTIVHPPVSLDEHVAVQRENKVRTLLLQALPEDHMPDFHHYDDARDIWIAVKARFGGNEESKKMRKTMLKQQFTEFSVTEEEGLHKGYDRFQKILSQLNQVQARPDNDDINLKFLRALPSSWSQVALALKMRGGLESMSFDDLYNKLRSLELDVRIGHSYGVKAAASPTHSAFIGAASSGSKLNYSNQQSIVPSVSQTSGHSDNIMECVLHSFVAENEPDQEMIYEDFDQVDQLEMEELDLKWQMAMLSLRINRFEKKAGRKMNYQQSQPADLTEGRYSAFKVTEVKTDEPKALVSVDSMVNWSDHAAENKTGEVEKVYGMMAGLHADNGGADAYQNAVKTLESQKDWYHKTQIALEDKIRAQKEKKEWEVKFEATLARFEVERVLPRTWQKLILASMSTRTKIGLGFKEYFGKDEVFDLSTPSVMYPEPVEEVKPLYSWFVKAGEMRLLFHPPSLELICPPHTSLTRGNDSDKSSDSETYASCDSSLKPRPKTSHLLLISRLFSESMLKNPNSTAGDLKCFVCGSKLHLIKDCDFYNCVNSVPCKSKAASVPAGSRNSPASVTAGGSDPAASRNRPAVNSAGRPNPAVIFRPSSVYFNNMYWPDLYDPMYMNKGRWGTAVKTRQVTLGGIKDHIFGDPRVMVDLINPHGFTLNDPQGRLKSKLAWVSQQKHLDESHQNRGTKGCSGNSKQSNKFRPKEGLVDGLPLKVFTNQHNCVACNKGKQHKASYKHISAVRLISEPLQLLHMTILSNNITVTILNTSDHLGKFEGKADEGYLVGYAPNSKAYRVYNLTNKRIEETLNLRFLEDKPNDQGIGHEWYFDLDYLTDSLGYTRFKTNKPAGTQETNINAGTQDTDSDSEVDEQVIVVPSFPSNSFAGPSSSNGPSVMERNADYAEELAKLQRQEYEAKDAAARYGYLFSQETAEILSQAEAEIRNQGVSTDRDPAGIDSAGGVSAGSTSAGSDPANGNPAGSFEPADKSNPAVSSSVSADYIPVHADESTLPPGQSLGSSANTTRFPLPSDVSKDQLSSGIFTSSSYDDDFSATLTNLAPAVEVNPVPTKRVNTIHPQSQILGDLASPVLTRSRAQKSKFGESAFIGYIQDQQRTNHTDQLHCLFACFLSQLEPTSIAKALEDPDWVAAMQEEMQQFINSKYGNMSLYLGKTCNRDKMEFLKTKGCQRNSFEGIKQSGYKLCMDIIKHLEPGDVRFCFSDTTQNYRRGTIDKTLFIKKDSRDILLVQVYVDDIIFGSTNKAWCDEFEVLMKGEFEMSAMGEMTFFLGLQFDMESVRTATTPYEAAKTKLKDETDPPVNCCFQTSSYSNYFSSECSQEDFQVSKRATKTQLVVVNTAARCTFFLLTGLVSAGRTMILLVVILSAGRLVSAGRTMILLVVILSAGRLVSAGRTMILLVVILSAGRFVSAGSYGLCCWFRVHAGGHISAGGSISADRVCVPAVCMISAVG